MRSWKDQALKSVDGSGNSRIMKFFNIETKNVANSSFQVFYLYEKDKKAYPFLSNKQFLENLKETFVFSE